MEGIDIHPIYQNVTDWDKVADSQDFCILKVSDGGAPYTKKSPDIYAAQMRARRKSMKIGGYHYCQFSPSPEAQADVLINEIRRLGLTDIVPMCDLEAPFSANETARNFGIRFCKRIEARGRRPGIYMSQSFAQVLRPDKWGIDELVIWIARYGGNPFYGGDYDLWQYTSSGQVPGISGSVDLNHEYTGRFLTTEINVSDLGPEKWDSTDWAEFDAHVWKKEFADWAPGKDPKVDKVHAGIILTFLRNDYQQVINALGDKIDALSAQIGSGPGGSLTKEDLEASLVDVKAVLNELRGLLPGV